MAKSTDAAQALVRELCLALPEAVETQTWGSPHFRVREKIFAGLGLEHGKTVVGFKLSLERQAQMLRDKRFTKAAYVGHKGWVSLDLAGGAERAELRALLIESYCAIAPKKLAAQLDGGAAAAVRKSVRRVTKKVTAKPATRKRATREPPDPRE